MHNHSFRSMKLYHNCVPYKFRMVLKACWFSEVKACKKQRSSSPLPPRTTSQLLPLMCALITPLTLLTWALYNEWLRVGETELTNNGCVGFYSKWIHKKVFSGVQHFKYNWWHWRWCNLKNSDGLKFLKMITTQHHTMNCLKTRVLQVIKMFDLYNTNEVKYFTDLIFLSFLQFHTCITLEKKKKIQFVWSEKQCEH